MSRTEIYNMMENRNINLSLGNNALDSFFNNGTGFLENFTNKLYNEKQDHSVSQLSGFVSPTWLMEFTSNILDDQVLIEDTYSLDDILEGKAMSPSSIASSDFIETPIGSPLSTSDESNYDIDELLLSACPEEVLASKVDSCPIPLAEHMYALTSPDFFENNGITNIVDVSTELDMSDKAALSPAASDDSGFTSASEESLDSQEDLLSQLLTGAFDFNVLSDEGFSQPTTSTIDENALSFNGMDTSVDAPTEVVKDKKTTTSSRPAPYKKTKTPEQKQRKKAQNRKAALRYRSKKNSDQDNMFDEADHLESKNKELRGKVDGLKNEIDYLKNLMLDVIKARLTNGGSVPDALSTTLLSSN